MVWSDLLYLLFFLFFPSRVYECPSKISFPISLTISEPKPAAHAHSNPPKPSPQGSVLRRWVCSDTLVRLKSQAGFINSYSGDVDTPFCIATNTRINSLWPGVLQNYISSYMIKSDWLHSAFSVRLSEITVCIYAIEEQTPSPW